jgi:hypothetical protein
VECVRCPWLLAETKVATILGKLFLLLLFLPQLFKTTERMVAGFRNLHGLLTNKNNKNILKVTLQTRAAKNVC